MGRTKSVSSLKERGTRTGIQREPSRRATDGGQVFNPTKMIAESFGDHIAETYSKHFEGRKPEYAAYLRGAATLVLQRIGNSDALYHNAEHTMMVTLVGQEIMRGRLFTDALKPEDWLHYIIALLLHDVGYTRGICAGDGDGKLVKDLDGNTFCPASAPMGHLI